MIIDSPIRSDIVALRTLWKQAFGDGDEFLDMFEKTAFSPARCRVAKMDGVPVAALYWFDCSCRGEKIAYLYAVATSREYRGMGLCSALMDDTHKHLERLGYKGAVLVPSNEPLFDFYKKRGYEVCSHIKEFSCRAADTSINIRSIDATEYARLRRELLPVGAVVQENENLSFLQAQTYLFVGDGVLFAARRNGDTLFCAELLGNTESAPAILTSLDCDNGQFRTVGKGRPFAMYRPFGDEKSLPPTYFGLAFD